MYAGIQKAFAQHVSPYLTLPGPVKDALKELGNWYSVLSVQPIR